jgi:hypothetical protein
MSVLIIDTETLACDVGKAAEAGAKLAETYCSAAPFPHIVLDDFVNSVVLKRLLDEWPHCDSKSFFNRSQERLKFQWERSEVRSPYIRAFLAEMNSPGVIRFLEEMTGICKLIPDPYFSGGGLHETKRGGHLGVHADFNIHTGLNLVRRINLLIYLNDDWEECFGGHLELWDVDMTKCVEEVSPVFGRAVAFNTDENSFHGHPKPLACPMGRSRKSVALYYYTAPETGIADLRKRTTQFKLRPGTNDKVDTSVKRQEIIEDWFPPVLRRAARRLARHMRSILRGHQK